MTDKEINTRIGLAVAMVAVAGVLLAVLLGGKP